MGKREYEQPGKDRKVRALPEHGTLNARIAQTVDWDQTETALEIFVQAKNLLDVYFEDAPEKAAAGRMLQAGLAFDF